MSVMQATPKILVVDDEPDLKPHLKEWRKAVESRNKLMAL